MKKVAIIGGGAAGIFAAISASKEGYDVHLYEKNDSLGKKMLITGKGRCNITNASDVTNIINNVVSNPYFMYSSLYALDAFAVIDFFNEIGLETKIERGNRVFPISDKSFDVVNALVCHLKKLKVNIHYNSRISKILTKDNEVSAIVLNKKNISYDSVIIATGGLSYNKTGSTGDGYEFAKNVGHTVTKLKPALVGLKCLEKWCPDLMGLSLKNVQISIKHKNKVIYKEFGEMLFTHYGVSGPIILSASSNMPKDNDLNYELFIDLKPSLKFNVLDERLLKDFNEFLNKDFKNALSNLFPQKLIPIIINLSNIDENKKVNSITKEERKDFCTLIKNLPLTITGTYGYREAIITSGGVDVDEINPSTMESKIIKNLYFAGEVLDVDAYTGGYNLQIAYSTGFLSGQLM